MINNDSNRKVKNQNQRDSGNNGSAITEISGAVVKTFMRGFNNGKSNRKQVGKQVDY